MINLLCNDVNLSLATSLACPFSSSISSIRQQSEALAAHGSTVASDVRNFLKAATGASATQVRVVRQEAQRGKVIDGRRRDHTGRVKTLHAKFAALELIGGHYPSQASLSRPLRATTQLVTTNCCAGTYCRTLTLPRSRSSSS